VRLRLNETPIFQKMKEEGKGSKSPLTDSFFRYPNNKYVLLALLGATAGQGVVWYTGQFYALFFLTQTLKVNPQTANLMIAAALLLGTPFFIVFGAWSDRIGRKKIILAGCALAIATYFPIFKLITHFANPALEAAISQAPVVVVADRSECSFQFNPVGTSKFSSSCDMAKAALVKRGVPSSNQAADPGATAVIRVGETTVQSFNGQGVAAVANAARFERDLGAALDLALYPAKADPARLNHGMVIALLFVLVLYVTMVYGPIAAMLVELFPTRIRYTSMSLPYHIGNGWFGGFLPTTSFAIVAATGNIYSGLWYPVIVAAMTLVIGWIFVPETKDVEINA
jgi:MFS family permease